MAAWPKEQFGRITHLEDEPPLALAQILAEGLRIGQIVRIVESTPERITLTDGENEFRLAPAVAANVFLAPASAPTALERNLNLVLQVLEITNKAVVAINLMDEARRKGIEIDVRSLSRDLGVPAVPVVARTGEGMQGDQEEFFEMFMAENLAIL